MLLVSAFRHLGNKDIAKRSTQRWRSLVVSLETSNIFLLKLYGGYACLKNIGKGVANYLEISYNKYSATSTFNFLNYKDKKIKKD